MRASRSFRYLRYESLENRIAMSATPLGELNGGGKGGSGGNSKLPYTYSVAGNAADVNVSLPSQSSGLALVGGSTDVDEVFRWMGAKAGGGDLLVIRATGTDAYDRYIDGLVPSLDSAATLIIPDRTAANHPDVARIIRQAEAIFIAGGDQGSYVSFWNNTPVETALYDAISRNVPIGGTSAGLAVLGEVDYSALAGSITSSEALANPLDPRITGGLDTGFLSPEQIGGRTILHYLDNVITDSHFMQRDRMGRLMTFMANMDAHNLVAGLPRGIAVNEQTALLVESNGMARVVGNPYDSKKLSATQQQRSVYLLQGATVNPTVSANVPLNYSARTARANYDPATGVGDVFDLDNLFASPTWSDPALDSYTVTASNGVLSPIDYYGMMSSQTQKPRSNVAPLSLDTHLV